jgi:uncharacterized protein YndB with AHSA1/START domain
MTSKFWTILGLCATALLGACSDSGDGGSETAQAAAELGSTEIKTTNPIEHEIVINGTAENVWKAIADFDNYGQWNQWVVKVEGKPELGATVKAYTDSGQHLDLKITSFVEPKEICWVDVTWFTHLGAGGWRCRRIEELPNGRGVRFVNHFEFTGIFSNVLESVSRDFLEKGMQQENTNLKSYIEGQ